MKTSLFTTKELETIVSEKLKTSAYKLIDRALSENLVGFEPENHIKLTKLIMDALSEGADIALEAVRLS